jgi:hypothetical protein
MRRFHPAFSLVALCAIMACEDGMISTPTSRLTVLLTDAPGDFESAVVTISKIYLQGSTADDPENGRVILLDEPVTTDLLTLSNDVADLVEGTSVAAGTYGQLRFVIDGAYIEVETETGTKVYATPGYAAAPAQVNGELMCPSCAQSGIKVNFAGGLQLDESTETILVDFDVAETFGKEAGNSGRWVMRPSLKATSVEAAASVSVSLGLGSGVVLPVIGGQVLTLAGFKVEMRSVAAEEGTPGELLPFADADANGTFDARYTNVLPGQYVLELRGPAGLTFSTSPAFPRTIVVESGTAFTSTFTITSASPAS